MIIYRSFSSFFAKEERFGSFKSLVLLVAFAILATSNTYAQASFETIGGLSYLIYPDAKTAALTFNPSGEKYSGNIVVPEKVKQAMEWNIQLQHLQIMHLRIAIISMIW